MGWWKYNIFKGTPKNLTELRKHQSNKIAEWYKEGSFYFALEASDGRPVLLISGDKKSTIKDEYQRLGAPKKAGDFITGTYTTASKSTIEFTTDPSYTSEASKKKVLEGMLKSGADLEIGFWASCVQAEATVLKLNGKVLNRRKTQDAEWKVAEWNLASIFTDNKNSVIKSAPLPGKWVGEQFIMPGGVTLGKEVKVKVVMAGGLVDKAEESPLIAQAMRDPVTGIMEELGEELKQKLADIDTKIAKTETDSKKPKATTAVNKALSDFETEYVTKVTEAINVAFCEWVETRDAYKQYVFQCRVKVAKSSITVGLGLIAASVGGITGVGAALGLAGTIKGALELGVDLYNIFRDIEGQAEELDKVLTATLNDYATKKNLVGWSEIGKNLLTKVPLGVPIQQIAAKFGKSVKTVKALKEDLSNYEGKVNGLLVKADELSKTLPALLDGSVKATSGLEDALLVQMAEEDKEFKKALEKLRAKATEAQEKLQKLIEQIQSKYKSFQEHRKVKLAAYKQMIEVLDGKVPTWSKVVTEVFMPALDVVYGIDPANISSTVLSAGSAALDMVSNGLVMLKKIDEDGGKAKADWIKYANDTAVGIKGLIEAVKG